MSRATDVVRRSVDILAAVLGLLITAPVLAAAALAIRLHMGSPVLFRQQRLGRGGAPFTVVKFRSMAHPVPGREGPEFDQERLGRLGRVLRASSIDELPSLWNLLRGEIALVGPRPLPVHYWPRFTDEQRRRFEVRPGLTGLAQIAGRNAVDWPERLALDVDYVARRSLRLDLTILVRTVPVVLGRGGIDHADGVTMHELPPQEPATARSTSRTGVGN